MLIKVIEVWEIHYKSGWHHFLGLGPGHHKKEKASWTQCVITPCFLTAYIMWLTTSSFCHHDGLYPWTASSINAFFFKMLLSGKFVTETSKVTKTITRKQLVTPMIFIPLLYQWVCLTRSLIIIAPRDLSWVLLLIFVFWQHNHYESYTLEMKLSGQFQVDFSIFYDSVVWCLHQWGLTIITAY